MWTRRNPVVSGVILGLLLILSVGCRSVEQFEGRWRGDVSQSRLVRRGVDLCSSMELTIDSVDSASLTARFLLTRRSETATCSGDVTGDGTVIPLPTTSVEVTLDQQFLNDSLSSMTVEGDPLFVHMGHATLPSPWGEEPVVVFLAYYIGSKVKVRLVSRNVYAAFSLNRIN